MFIKRMKSKNFVYLSLVETYREGGKVKHRTLAKLGRLDQIKDLSKLDRLEASLKALSKDRSYVCIEELEEESRHNWGAVVVCRTLWKNLGLDYILNKTLEESRCQFNLEETVFLEVVSRLNNPCSKYRLFQTQEKYHGTKPMDLQHLYRALNHLSHFKDQIEEYLFKKRQALSLIKVDLVLYDVTTIYFESVKADDLRNFGYSKDCKFGEVQIVLGMLVTTDGQPIACDVYNGNTFESKTLEKALNNLRKRFEIRQVIIVADRGINAKLNLKKIKDAGFDYLIGCRLRGMKKSVKESVLSGEYKTIFESENHILKSYQMDYVNKVEEKKDDGSKTIHLLEEKLYCFWSSSRAEKDRKDREKFIAKAEKLIKQPERKTGARRYVKKSKQTKELDHDKIKEDRQWDGFYAIESSKKKMPPEEVRSNYHTLWRIEESFRILKTNLEIRPVFHWTEERIIGHVVVCFLAFLLERTLEIELINREKQMSPDRIQTALNSLEFSKIMAGNTTYHLRSAISEDAAAMLDVLDISIPPSICKASEFNEHLGKNLVLKQV